MYYENERGVFLSSESLEFLQVSDDEEEVDKTTSSCKRQLRDPSTGVTEYFNWRDIFYYALAIALFLS